MSKADAERMDEFFETVTYAEDRPVKSWRDVEDDSDDEPTHLTHREKLVVLLDWNEADHPRDDAGRFDDGGSASPRDRAIDAKREQFHAVVGRMEAIEAQRQDKRVELHAAWQKFAEDVKNRKKPLKPDGAAAKKLDSYKTAKALETAFHDDYEKTATLLNAATNEAKALLKVPVEERSRVSFRTSEAATAELHPMIVRGAERALADFRQYDASGAFQPLTFPADKVEKFREVFGDHTKLDENPDGTFSLPSTLRLEKADSGRAHATLGGIAISGGRELERQVYHEVAHHIEMNSPAALKAAIAVRDKLANSPREVYKLNTVSPSLGDDEKALRGKFPDPYVGKIYPNDMATEMISTGVESYIKDPISFARDRPEQFKLVFDVMHGKYKSK